MLQRVRVFAAERQALAGAAKLEQSLSQKRKPDPISDSEYFLLIDAVGVAATLVMFELGRSSSTGHIISRNFVARGKRILDAIRLLWQAEAYSDCWSLHRTLLDRLFHLHVLSHDKSFAVFEEWSFIQQYEARNAILSDPDFRDKLDPSFVKSDATEQSRYKQLKARGVTWSRPKAEDAAKLLGYPFLYKYGYDFASTHIHPMANDGQDEFLRITRLGAPRMFEHKVILRNSVLAYILLVQEALVASQLRWNSVVVSFFESAVAALSGDVLTYKLVFQKFDSVGPEGPWSDLPRSTG